MSTAAEYELVCPNCGASASLPLGMTCDDHRPALIPPRFEDTCCGTCGPGLCGIDEMTGA